MNASTEFLERAFAGREGFVSVVAINPFPVKKDGSDKIRAKSATTDDIASLADWIKTYDGHWNLYWAVNRPRKLMGKKATKEEVATLDFLQVDIDPNKGERVEDAKPRIKAMIDAFEPKPNIIIDSGNGYACFWRVRDPPLVNGNIDKLEDYNKRLAIAFGGDDCWSIDHIMRLPGTTNLPTHTKLAKGRVSCPATLVYADDGDYALEDFDHLPVAAAKTSEPPPQDDGEAQFGSVPQRIQRLAQRDKRLRLLLTADPSVAQRSEGGAVADRSALDWALACQLRRMKCYDDEIAATLCGYGYGKATSPDDKYVERTLARLREEIPQKAEEAAPPVVMPRIYSAGDLAQRPFVEREWVVAKWLPAKVGAVLAGHGGVGKSQIAAMLCVCVASGTPFYGLEVTQGPVVLYSCEDDSDAWRDRFLHAAAHLKIAVEGLPISVVDACDFPGDPTLFAPLATDSHAPATITSVGAWLAEQVQEKKPALVILDAAADTFGGNEIARREVRSYLRTMQREIGCCVLHILHIDKIAARSRGQVNGDLYSGSTDWNNGVRARLALYRPPAEKGDDEDEEVDDEDRPVRLELQKSNYSRKGAFVELLYDDDSHVFERVGDSVSAVQEKTAKRPDVLDDRAVILGALAKMSDAGDPALSSEYARRNAATRLKAMDALPPRYRDTKGCKRLTELLLRAKDDGLLVEETTTTASRNKISVWRVTDAGRRIGGGV